jgi:hypothetical protein
MNCKRHATGASWQTSKNGCNQDKERVIEHDNEGKDCPQ